MFQTKTFGISTCGSGTLSVGFLKQDDYCLTYIIKYVQNDQLSKKFGYEKAPSEVGLKSNLPLAPQNQRGPGGRLDLRWIKTLKCNFVNFFFFFFASSTHQH